MKLFTLSAVICLLLAVVVLMTPEGTQAVQLRVGEGRSMSHLSVSVNAPVDESSETSSSNEGSEDASEESSEEASEEAEEESEESSSEESSTEESSEASVPTESTSSEESSSKKEEEEEEDDAQFDIAVKNDNHVTKNHDAELKLKEEILKARHEQKMKGIMRKEREVAEKQKQMAEQIMKSQVANDTKKMVAAAREQERERQMVRTSVYRPEPRMILAESAAFDACQNYTVSFWVKPFGVVEHWHGLFQKGAHGQRRSPATWFYPNSLRLHIRSSTTKQWNFGRDAAAQLPLWSWTHVVFTHQPGSFKIWYDGRLVVEDSRDAGEVLRNNDPMYAALGRAHPSLVGDVRHMCQSVDDKDVKQIMEDKDLDRECPAPSILIPSETRVVSSGVFNRNMLASHAVSFTFWLRLDEKRNGWTNVFQRSGSRSIAVFVYHQSTRLHIRSATRRSWNDGGDPTPQLKLGKWTHIAVVHFSGYFAVYYDGKQVYLRKNIQQPRLATKDPNTVRLDTYRKNPAYQISDLRYYNVGLSKECLEKIVEDRKCGKDIRVTGGAQPRQVAKPSASKSKSKPQRKSKSRKSSGRGCSTRTRCDIEYRKKDSKSNWVKYSQRRGVCCSSSAATRSAWVKRRSSSTRQMVITRVYTDNRPVRSSKCVTRCRLSIQIRSKVGGPFTRKAVGVSCCPTDSNQRNKWLARRNKSKKRQYSIIGVYGKK